jgi:hypothetical protein
LEPADQDAFTGHLPSCERCRSLVTDMTDVAANLAYGGDPVDPPPSLWQGIAAAVADSERPPLAAQAPRPDAPAEAGVRPGTAYDPSPAVARWTGSGSGSGRPPDDGPPMAVSDRGSAWRRRPAWVRSTALAVAAALIGIVGLGGVVVVGRFLQVRSDKATAERQLSAVLTCAGLPGCAVVPLKPRAGSSASAVALVRSGNVQLVVDHLAPTGHDSAYVLWTAKPGGAMTGVGRFLIANGGRHIISPDLKASIPVVAGTVLAVTREPGPGIPDQPTVPPTLQGAA